jgi:hypothetical protein
LESTCTPLYLVHFPTAYTVRTTAAQG